VGFRGAGAKEAMITEIIGDATLYLGDCKDILPSLEPVDAVVTDPPYGVNFGGKNTKFTKRRNQGYRSGDDHHDALKAFDLWKTKRIVLTPGIRNFSEYPKPDDMGVIYYPGGAGLGRWGFTCSQPIFYYGKCPYLENGLGHRPNSFTSNERSEKNGHPCPKPILTMEWLVNKATLTGETILDPFMGSGTTGVAALNLGRKFIGVEKEAEYFEIACKRISDAERQADFFIQGHKQEQLKMAYA
tara:strand:- start:285 stop:1013 length:729 start_codon:yes stop_codon:yes gene_type:complete